MDKSEYYLDIALTVAKKSTCLKKHYGAVIVNNDEIVSTGYVGAPRGRQNCIDIIENGFSVLDLDFSPIKGPEGNIEYLIYIEKCDEPVSKLEATAADIVKASHEKLSGGDCK